MKNGWKKIRLKEVCEITSSKRIYAADYQNEGIPFFRGKEIIEKQKGIIAVSTELYISKEKFRSIKSKFGAPQVGELLLTSVGTLGVPYVIKEGEEFYFKDGNLTWFKNFIDLDVKFLYYWFLSPFGKAQLKKSTIGSSQPAFTIVLLKDLEIKLPPLDTQRKIASILSAYDDLIENTTRRITILEEMASAIYREWFVEFRFSNVECRMPLRPAPSRWDESPFGNGTRVHSGNVELRIATPEEKKLTGKDLFPKGWEARPLQSLTASLTDGDWIETKDQGGEDYRLLQVSNIGVSEFAETGNYRYITQDTFDRLRCQEVLPGDILISRMPKPTGRAWLVTLQPWKMITAVDVAIAKVDDHKADPYFVLYLLNSLEQIDQVERRTTGTTRPRISRSSLASIPVVVPPILLQKSFGKFTNSNYQLSTTLRNKNTNLRRTRDLLLPKLISGEIDVEGININTIKEN
ncbi:MAG: restriction endonuclease subunit S [Bacteroidota bacterium]